MANNRQLIQELYQDLIDRNISKVLPVLDEHIQIKLPESLPFGGTFQGREGFIAFVTKMSQVWESLHIKRLDYYMPEDALEDTLIVLGEVEGKGEQKESVYTSRFVNYWQFENKRITSLHIFLWDTVGLLTYLHADTGPSLNGGV